MNHIERIIKDLQAGEPPEACLHDLEKCLEPLTGKLPDNRDDMNQWVNSSLAVFYLLRFCHLARYYPQGHERVDLLHKAAALIPSGALDAPTKDEAILTVDLEA